MFDFSDCDVCYAEAVVPRMYPPWNAFSHMCSSCYVQRCATKLGWLCPPLVTPSPPLLLVAQFLAEPYGHACRLRHLWCALMARRSVFRQLTYSGNGDAGNVNDTTDIIDVVLRFL